MKYGKKPAASQASFKFSTYFNKEALPKPPLVFGANFPTNWGVLGNQDYGCCVEAGAAHEHQLWRSQVGQAITFTTAAVLSAYSTITGFNPKDPNSDQGTDLQDAAEYRRKVGIPDASQNLHTIDAYVGLSVGNVDELVQAVYLLGAVGIGFKVPNTVEDQFTNEVPWDKAPATSPIVGGHYVACIGRNSAGNLLVVSWGRIQAMTPAFYQAYNDESLAYISIDALNAKGLSPRQFNREQLQADLKALGTRPLSNKPVATVTPDPVQGLNPFIKMILEKIARSVATAIGTWLATIGILSTSTHDPNNLTAFVNVGTGMLVALGALGWALWRGKQQVAAEREVQQLRLRLTGEK